VGDPLRTFETPDGRTLAFAAWGDPEGFPILALHGTPGLNRSETYWLRRVIP
jgi:hypothetical protein